jgi:hypothetical protein
MKKLYIALAVVVLLGGAYLVLRTDRNPGEDSSLPALSDYSTSSVYNGSIAPVDFSTNEQAEEFRTQIVNGVESNGVNFAGYYSVVTWGCGTGCQSSAIIDVRTGEIVSFGIISARGLKFAENSRLLVVNPKENLTESELAELENQLADSSYPLGTIPAVAEYYTMENGELTFLEKYSVISGESQVCIQVMAVGRNPITGEQREFPTPCHIPFGWESLELGEGVM